MVQTNTGNAHLHYTSGQCCFCPEVNSACKSLKPSLYLLPSSPKQDSCRLCEVLFHAFGPVLSLNIFRGICKPFNDLWLFKQNKKKRQTNVVSTHNRHLGTELILNCMFRPFSGSLLQKLTYSVKSTKIPKITV